MIRLLWTRAGLLILMLSLSCLAQDTAQADQVVMSYASRGEFMGSVLIARNGRVVFLKGYGEANLEWAIPNTPSTRFRIGSLSKQFTAAAILLLEERGKLRVEETVATYLRNVPNGWKAITIANLLNHVSGIPEYTQLPDAPSWSAVPSTTPEQLMSRFRDLPLDFAPGQDIRYSNSGYVVLGALIESISGQSYESFLRQNIFQPLGMKDSGYDSNAALIPRRASGYELTPSGPRNAPFVETSNVPAALYSTTEDLLRWEEGLFGGKVLSASSLRKMTSPLRVKEATMHYGFGLVISRGEDDDRLVIEHGGRISGFESYMTYYPDEKLAIIVLSNIDTGRAVPMEIAARLAARAFSNAK